ncbi:MAG: S-layer family protein, partial [Scytonema sp. PMC 1069.18]|nr:S-layer family protein [Scytonema sp. PMC 1069.18]
GVGHDINYEEITNPPRFTPRGRVNTNREGLQVKEGQTLALLGGNITLNGSILKAPFGRIEIASVGSNQSVNFQQPGKFIDENITSFGDIQVSGKSFVSTTGNGGGEIAIAGRNISLTEQSLLLADNQGNRDGGGISIKGDSILWNQSTISANTYGTGNGGLIQLNAKNMTFENNSGASIAAEESTGNAGVIQINADSLIFRNRGGLNTNTYSQGSAGRISIVANSLQLDGSEQGTIGLGSVAEYGSTGSAGAINIDIAGPMVVKSAGITTDAFGTESNPGTINITANSLQIENSGVLSRIDNPGKAGEININVADSFIGKNSIYIDTSNYGQGDGGKISIIANSVLLENGVGIFSSQDKNRPGNAGEININVADSVILRNGVGIKSNIAGAGNAGKIFIAAKSFLLERGELSSRTEENSSGDGGEINIQVKDSVVINEAFISTLTSGKGNAGNVNINANSFVLKDSGVNSATEENSTGNAGDINIKVAGSFTINTASINTQASGLGNAGRITVDAESLTISNFDSDNNSVGIFATSQTGQGGNIQLNIGDLLLLRGRSSISTSAGENQNSTGNGGNITIYAPRGFIVTVPNENSDITANAFGGSGGKIILRAADLFGIAPLTRQELERLSPGDLDPSQLPTNDITAISQQNPSLSGIIDINNPEVDPSQGLVELPVVVVDTTDIVDTGCAAFANGKGSEFTITGRGGLPSSPDEPLTTDVLWSDTRLSSVTSQQPRSEKPAGELKSKTDVVEIVPATGWVFNGKGEVTLISHASNTSGARIMSGGCLGTSKRMF